MERKTHHEKYIGIPSIKERFPLALGLLPGFLAGQVTPRQALEHMQLNGQLGTGEVERHLTLAEECQTAIVANNYTPRIRTV